MMFCNIVYTCSKYCVKNTTTHLNINEKLIKVSLKLVYHNIITDYIKLCKVPVYKYDALIDT